MSYSNTSIAVAESERKKFIQKLRDEKIAGLQEMIASVRSGAYDEELLSLVGDMPAPYIQTDIISFPAAAAAAAIDDAYWDVSASAAQDNDDISSSKKNKYYGVTQHCYANRTIGFRVSIGTVKIGEDGKKIKSVRAIKGRFSNAEDAARAYDAAAREEIANGSLRKYKFNFQY